MLKSLIQLAKNIVATLVAVTITASMIAGVAILFGMPITFTQLLVPALVLAGISLAFAYLSMWSKKWGALDPAAQKAVFAAIQTWWNARWAVVVAAFKTFSNGVGQLLVRIGDRFVTQVPGTTVA